MRPRVILGLVGKNSGFGLPKSDSVEYRLRVLKYTGGESLHIYLRHRWGKFGHPSQTQAGNVWSYISVIGVESLAIYLTQVGKVLTSQTQVGQVWTN